MLQAVQSRMESYFNAKYAATAATLLPTVVPDFTLSNLNFFLGQLRYLDFTNTSTFTKPVIVMWAGNAVDRHEQKPALFSGPVEIGMKVYITGKLFKASSALVDFEVWPSVFEGALIRTLADPTVPWPTCVTYAGIAFKSSMLSEQGEGWLQELSVSVNFEVTFAG